MVVVTSIKIDAIAPGNYYGVLDNGTPSLSWELKGSEKDWYQGAYQVCVVYGDRERVVYDPVQSEDSSYITWPGRKLKSKERISVSIRVSSSKDLQVFSEWSKPFSIETGILENQWDSPFIANEKQKISRDRIAPETIFRKEFHLEQQKKIRSARVYSTALGIYEISINGSKIGEDFLSPGWTSYDHRLLHQVYDVSSNIRESGNVIIARVAAGWYSGYVGFDGGATNIYGDRRAISLELNIVYEDDSVQSLTTDESWKSSTGPITNAQLYDGETYDATLKKEGSELVGYDDSQWNNVEVVNCSAKEIVPQSFGYVTCCDVLKPVEIIKTASGKTVVDFGQNSVGVLRFTNITAPRGHTVVLKHAEVMENGELGTRPLREAKCTDTYTFKGDAKGESYMPRFTYHGFRYAQIDNWYGEFTKESVELVVLSTKMDSIGSFHCADQHINRLYENVFHSTRGNFLSIPADCPQRDERMGWLGDIAVFSPTALYMFDCYPFIRSWLQDLKHEQEANGGFPPVVVPSVLHAYETPWNGVFCSIWQDACVMVPHALYEATNNKSILETQYKSMETWIDFLPKMEGKMRWAKTGIQLGDWLDPTAPPDNPLKAMTDAYLVSDAFLYLVLTQMVHVSEALGKKEAVIKYKSMQKRCRQDFMDEYISNSGRLVCETQTAYALCICFNLLSESQIKYAGERLSQLCESNDYKIGTGFAGTPYVTEALVRSGHLETAYKMLLEKECPSWLYPVSMGATTVWERWNSMMPDGSINPGSMTSFNHYALGAVANWMFERMGGILLGEPGWKSFSLKPKPGGSIHSCETSHKSSYGLISSKWKILGDFFYYDIQVPLNCTAEVELPDGQNFKVGSGSYSYSCKIEYKRFVFTP